MRLKPEDALKGIILRVMSLCVCLSVCLCMSLYLLLMMMMMHTVVDVTVTVLLICRRCGGCLQTWHQYLLRKTS